MAQKLEFNYFIATGADMQSLPLTLAQAILAAEHAPWADGRVYGFEERPPFGSLGESGTLVYDAEQKNA